MKDHLGRRDKIDLSSIEKYCTYANIMKQNFIDYLQLVVPLFSDNLDKKSRDQLYDTITEIFFGPEQREDKIKEIKSILPQMEKALKSIKTISAEELQGDRAANVLKKLN